MTEEEKEAIEYIQQFIGIEKKYECLPIKVKTLPNTRNAIQVILNLIQKQDTEINKLNNIIDRILRDIYECIQNDDNATILSIKDYGDYNTFEQIKDKYKEYL